jgi:hypothetical protein
MSLLMSLLPASGEFVSEFPSPRVILSVVFNVARVVSRKVGD